MDKSILITGCASGIGYASAHEMRRQGWRVFATCRQEVDCETLRREGFESFRLDYSDEDSIRQAVTEVKQRNKGKLGALFNNGAFACPGAVEDLPRGALRAIFETNVFGYHDLTCQVIPMMRAAGSGAIVNCSSVLGLVPYTWRGAYVSSKFALEGLTDVLRLEMRSTGINIILIEPGPITSRIRENSIPHFEKWVDWENSPRRPEYEEILHRLYRSKNAPDRFELPAQAVAKTLARALNSPKPKPRYYVTKATHLMGFAKRILSSRALDWLITRG